MERETTREGKGESKSGRDDAETELMMLIG